MKIKSIFLLIFTVKLPS